MPDSMDRFVIQLSETQLQRYQTAAQDFRQRVLEQLPSLLSRVPSEQLQEQMYDLLFTEDSQLSDRSDRPHLAAAYHAERVYTELTESPTHTDALLQFAVAVQEYYDTIDDLADGDVSYGRSREGLLTSQGLVPIFVHIADELPEGAASFWAERAARLPEAPLFEIDDTASKDTYLTILDRQSNLWGGVTGLAAYSAEAGPEELTEAERFGRAMYKIDAVCTDRLQYDDGTDLRWNIYSICEREEIADLLTEWIETAEDCVDAIATDDPLLMRAPIAVDVTEPERR